MASSSSFLDAAQALMEEGDMELLLLRSCDDDAPPPQALRMRCHSTLIKLASPLFKDLLDACPPTTCASATTTTAGGSPPLLALKVDGSELAWQAILCHLYSIFCPPPPRSCPPAPTSTAAAAASAATAALPAVEGGLLLDPPETAAMHAAAAAAVAAFTWTSAREMLPVLHQYDMRSLQHRRGNLSSSHKCGSVIPYSSRLATSYILRNICNTDALLVQSPP